MCVWRQVDVFASDMESFARCVCVCADRFTLRKLRKKPTNVRADYANYMKMEPKYETLRL